MGARIISDNTPISLCDGLSPYERVYFRGIALAREAVKEGYRLSYEESLKAYNNGFPQPQPGCGQVWWLCGGASPIYTSRAFFSDQRWTVPMMVKRNEFHLYDGKMPEYVPETFLYAPTHLEVEQFWNHSVQVSHGVLDPIY